MRRVVLGLGAVCSGFEHLAYFRVKEKREGERTIRSINRCTFNASEGCGRLVLLIRRRQSNKSIPVASHSCNRRAAPLWRMKRVEVGIRNEEADTLICTPEADYHFKPCAHHHTQKSHPCWVSNSSHHHYQRSCLPNEAKRLLRRGSKNNYRTNADNCCTWRFYWQLYCLQLQYFALSKSRLIGYSVAVAETIELTNHSTR